MFASTYVYLRAIRREVALEAAARAYITAQARLVKPKPQVLSACPIRYERIRQFFEGERHHGRARVFLPEKIDGSGWSTVNAFTRFLYARPSTRLLKRMKHANVAI